jgi:hypothetical protein
MKKVIFLLMLPVMAFGRNTSKYEDAWKKYVSQKVDSLCKLPGSSVIDTKKETTVIYYVNGKRQVQTFSKPVMILKNKSK